MCDPIGDIPIQDKEQKSWTIGENRGINGVDHCTAGVNCG